MKGSLSFEQTGDLLLGITFWLDESPLLLEDDLCALCTERENFGAYYLVS